MKQAGRGRFPPQWVHERKLRGWSQAKLAEELGSDRRTVGRWESGEVFPSAYFRQKLCELFGKNAEELGLLQEDGSNMPEEVSLQSTSDQNETPADSTALQGDPSFPALPIWSVPHRRNPFFIDRERILTFLHEQLSATRTVTLTHAQALCGLGGIGKTQIAVEYVYRYGEEYANVLWARAATYDTLVADFVILADHLQLPERDESDQQRIVAAVKRWLAAHGRWLLILDNADDLQLVQDFLPTSYKGRILLTTRAQAVGGIASGLEVEKMALEEGTLLLLRRTRLLATDASLNDAREADREVAGTIVEEMDGLPLALVQAGAYMEETGCGLSDYLQLYRMRRKELLARRSSFSPEYADTVATTWSLSFQRVEQADLAAADLLRLCAFLAPDAIPEELLSEGALELGAVLGAVATDAFKLNESLEVLRRYSLVRRNADTRMLSIHRLVQIVLKESMSHAMQHEWAERAVRAVNRAFPDASFETTVRCQSYLPHVQVCAALIEQHHLWFPETARMLHQAGIYLYMHGLYAQAEPLYQQALAMRDEVLGLEHADTAQSLNDLAVIYRIQGRYELAESLHRRALAIREQVLGSEHPSTAESLNNLAVLYREQTKYEETERLLKRALTIREQALGPDDPETSNTLINLAKLYSEQKKYEQAESLYRRAQASRERAFGPKHPLIAQILNPLGELFYEQGKYDEAESLLKQALSMREEMLGSEHASTAESLNSLAELYSAQGLNEQAKSFLERALNICETMLGSEHHDTVTVRESYNELLRKME